MNVNGNVQIGDNTGTSPAAIGATTGVTVNAASDNAHINLTLSAAPAGVTNTVTVGNGNDEIKDTTTAGAVIINAGTGANLINVSAGAATTYSAKVSFGTHTGVDKVYVSNVVAAASAVNTIISGVSASDIIVTKDANAITIVTPTAAQLTAMANGGTGTGLAGALSYAEGLLTAAHSAIAFGYGGNTYVVESAAIGTGTLTANDTFIELTGTHTIIASATIAQIAILS